MMLAIMETILVVWNIVLTPWKDQFPYISTDNTLCQQSQNFGNLFIRNKRHKKIKGPVIAQKHSCIRACLSRAALTLQLQSSHALC